MRELQLGLGDPPVRRFLYVAQDEQGTHSCWYELDHGSDPPKKVFITQRALTGYITGIRVKRVTTKKHGDKDKLDILMDAGQPFCIRAGVDTNFARGVILSLMSIETGSQLTEALTIVVTPSKTNSKIVFGSLYIAATGQHVKFDWDKDVDLEDLIQVLQTVVGDGGQQSDNEAGDREHGSDASDDGQERSESKPGLANADQIKELKRCGVSAGYIKDDGGKDVLDIDALNRECKRLYPAIATIEDLTVGQAIEFRKTLLDARL